MKLVSLFSLILFLVSGCATTTKFPVSNVVPAATIKVSEKKDKNENTVINVVANNLASAERLNPSKNVYVVWISTRNRGVINIGQLKHENAKKSTLETKTAFEPLEVFITAENQGNITYPAGSEISRVSLGSKEKSSLY